MVMYAWGILSINRPPNIISKLKDTNTSTRRLSSWNVYTAALMCVCDNILLTMICSLAVYFPSSQKWYFESKHHECSLAAEKSTPMV